MDESNLQAHRFERAEIESVFVAILDLGTADPGLHQSTGLELDGLPGRNLDLFHGLGILRSPRRPFTNLKDPELIWINDEAWRDLEFEVLLDSGSVVQVCSIDGIPGYRLGESPGSTKGQAFLMGDGGTTPNPGQSQLNLSDTGSWT